MQEKGSGSEEGNGGEHGNNESRKAKVQERIAHCRQREPNDQIANT